MRTLHNLVLAAVCAASSLTVQAQTTGDLNVLGDNHALYRLQQKHKFLLLPIEEKEENAHLRIIKNNQVVKELNCRLAIDKTDYSVPLKLDENQDSEILIDITFSNNRRSTGSIKDFVAWKELKTSDSFDTTNREKYRPTYHHTPQWGWMNAMLSVPMHWELSSAARQLSTKTTLPALEMAPLLPCTHQPEQVRCRV